MKRVLTALVLAPLVLALVFLGPKWLITLVVAGVAMLAAWEFLALTEHRGATPPRLAVLVAIGCLFLGNYQWPEETATLFGLLAIGLLVYCTFSSPVERALADTTSCIFALFYLGLTLLTLPMLREVANGPSLLAFLFLTVWAGDTAAMYVGRGLGRNKLAPTLSPNKTWEGSIGSVLGSVAVAGILLSAWRTFSHSGTRSNSPRSRMARGGTGYSWPRWSMWRRRWADSCRVRAEAFGRREGFGNTSARTHGGILDRIDRAAAGGSGGARCGTLRVSTG